MTFSSILYRLDGVSCRWADPIPTSLFYRRMARIVVASRVVVGGWAFCNLIHRYCFTELMLVADYTVHNVRVELLPLPLVIAFLC